MTFLPSSLLNILNRGNYSQDNVNISNNHPALVNYVAEYSAIATALGIDFDATGYTIRSYVSKGERKFTSPVVMANSLGEAVVVWGNVNFPLADVETDLDLEIDGKFASIGFSFGDEEDYITIPLALGKFTNGEPDAKGQPLQAAEIRQLFRKGQLGQALRQTFIRPSKLSELAPGEYTILAYQYVTSFGERKPIIFIEGKGWFRTNTRLQYRLMENPVIDADHPATLEVSVSTRTTSTGYPIIPVELILAADADIPVFDF